MEKTAAGATNASWAYAYDKAGNRTSQTRVGNKQAEAGTLSYGYNAAHQLTSINGDASHLGFDADGNETAAAGDDWVNVSQREATISPIGDVTAMTTHNSAGDQSFEYGYAGVNPGQYLLTWAHGEQIGHSLLGIASQVDPGGVAQKILRGPNGKPLAVIRGTGAEQRVGYVIPDRLGSVIGLIGANTAGGTGLYRSGP